MNPATSFTRACARCSRSIRLPAPRQAPVALRTQQYLSTSASRHYAMIIDLSSRNSTTPQSSSAVAEGEAPPNSEPVSQTADESSTRRTPLRKEKREEARARSRQKRLQKAQLSTFSNEGAEGEATTPSQDTPASSDIAADSSAPTPLQLLTKTATTATAGSKPKKTSSQSTTKPRRRPPPPTIYVGHVSRTGTMLQTVQITRQHQFWDKTLKKHYTKPLRLLAHDPNPANFLREGDVVEYSKWNAKEEQAREQKKQDVLNRQLEKAMEEDQERLAKRIELHGPFDPMMGPTVKKLLRAREREAKVNVKYKIPQKKGIQFVVRKVVTPFAVPLEERMDALNIAADVPESASQGGTGTDSLLKSRGGNASRQHANAAVAG